MGWNEAEDEADDAAATHGLLLLLSLLLPLPLHHLVEAFCKAHASLDLVAGVAVTDVQLSRCSLILNAAMAEPHTGHSTKREPESRSEAGRFMRAIVESQFVRDESSKHT